MRHPIALALAAAVVGCGTPTDPDVTVHDPATAATVAVDRFADGVGMLFARSANDALPDADEPIDFDQAPFVTQGLGPDGMVVRYYNFDVQPTTPAPIYVLFHEDGTMVPDQLNIIDVIPGDAGYNDFWQVVKVTVPDDYVANELASASAVADSGYATETTDMLVNCPVVPEGSTATLRLGDESAGITRGWYKDQLAPYFSFEEAPLAAAGGSVPVSPIYVSFNVNPDEAGGGPASGFVTEMDTEQTHNVVATVPGDAGYSPLWSVNVYDNADFESVADLDSATGANILATGVADVNCPVVDIDG